MLELMVNHISPASEQFQDFLEKGDDSPHASMFIDWDKFWGEGKLKLTVISSSPVCDGWPSISNR